MKGDPLLLRSNSHYMHKHLNFSWMWTQKSKEIKAQMVLLTHLLDYMWILKKYFTWSFTINDCINSARRKTKQHFPASMFFWRGVCSIKLCSTSFLLYGRSQRPAQCAQSPLCLIHCWQNYTRYQSTCEKCLKNVSCQGRGRYGGRHFTTFYGLHMKFNSAIPQVATFPIARHCRIITTTVFIAKARLLWQRRLCTLWTEYMELVPSGSPKRKDSCMFQMAIGNV